MTQHWRESANCIDAPLEYFFAEDREDGGEEDYDTALIARGRLLCGACPVKHQCLEDGLENDPKWGLLGGADPKQRRKILLTRALNARGN